jgi:hypoxanthine-guanine phosphoribosyltransferase
MTETESSIYTKRLAEREDLEDRISLIERACQIFNRGFDEDVFTVTELRGACRFLSKLIRSFDKDASDLCLLASRAENMEQFQTVCRMSRQRWRTREDVEKRVDDYFASRM